MTLTLSADQAATVRYALSLAYLSDALPGDALRPAVAVRLAQIAEVQQLLKVGKPD